MNRVLGLKFVPNDSHLLISGGLDSNLFLWDDRMFEPARNLFGPQVSGETIDMKDDTILVGNYQGSSAIQLIDFKSFKEYSALKWNKPGTNTSSSFHLYSTMFSKADNDMSILAGSWKNNDLRFYTEFNLQGSHEKVYKNTLAVKGLSGGVFCSEISKANRKIVFGTSDKELHLLQQRSLI